MKRIFFFPVLAFLLWNATPASAQENGTAPEAQAMLEKAVASLKADEAATISKFSRRDSGFVDRDLYVLCFSTVDGKISSHLNQSLIGTDIRSIKGADGSALGQRFFDAAVAVKNDGSFTKISYKFPKPGTSAPVSKAMYLTRVHQQGCGVSYYE